MALSFFCGFLRGSVTVLLQRANFIWALFAWLCSLISGFSLNGSFIVLSNLLVFNASALAVICFAWVRIFANMWVRVSMNESRSVMLHG